LVQSKTKANKEGIIYINSPAINQYISTHAHVKLTQLNIIEGLKSYGNMGDEAILKQLRQIHTRQALLPCNKDEMSYYERKKAL